MNVIQEYAGELGSQTIFSFTIQNDHGVEVTKEKSLVPLLVR